MLTLSTILIPVADPEICPRGGHDDSRNLRRGAAAIFFFLAFIGAGGPGLRAPWIRYWIPPTTTPVTGNSAAYYLCYK